MGQATGCKRSMRETMVIVGDAKTRPQLSEAARII